MRPTNRQRELLAFLVNHALEKGHPPTLREMADHLGLRSLSSVRQHLNSLARQGLVERRPGLSRGAVPTRKAAALLAPQPGGIPLVGQVKAGIPQTPVKTGPIWKKLTGMAEPASIVLLRVADDAMSREGIFAGDVVLVRRDRPALDGEIVAIRLDDRILVRRLRLTRGRRLLQPSAGGYAKITAGEEMPLNPVIGLVRRMT